MPEELDIAGLRRQVRGYACWTPPDMVDCPGYMLPAFARGLRYDTGQAADVEALRHLGIRVSGPGSSCVVLEAVQQAMALDLVFEASGCCVVIGLVRSLSGHFAFGGRGCVVVSSSPAEVITLSVSLVGHGAGFYLGAVVCYGVRAAVEAPHSIRVGIGGLLSDRIDLRATDSHSIVDLETGRVLNEAGSITIEPRVWLAHDVTVLKDVCVGEGSIVAARSLLTKDVPRYSLAGGSPARILRAGVSWHRNYPSSPPGQRYTMTGNGLSTRSGPGSAADAAESGSGDGGLGTPVQAAQVVEALYRTLLFREPEPGSIARWSTLLSGPMGVEGVIRALLQSEEFGLNGPQFRAAYLGSAASRFTNDVSQYGEVDRLLRRWVNEAARHRIVVDVGARGRERSNSYDLMRSFGWQGVLVEANATLIPLIAAEFAGLRFELVHCAVSDYEGQARFHLGMNEDVSSLNEGAAREWGALTGSQLVDVKRLGPLLRERAIPQDFDLLSLDIEGEDIKVLNDVVAGGYRPRWVIIEASYDFATTSLHDIPLSDLVRSSYTLVDQTAANLIMRAVDGAPEAAQAG